MKFKVWYGKEWEEGSKQTFVFVKEIEAETPEEAYCEMQGETWSPNGEARPLIESLGLRHTSMSSGDALQDENGDYLYVAAMGFTKIKELPTIVRRLFL